MHVSNTLSGVHFPPVKMSHGEDANLEDKGSSYLFTMRADPPVKSIVLPADNETSNLILTDSGLTFLPSFRQVSLCRPGWGGAQRPVPEVKDMWTMPGRIYFIFYSYL